MMMSAWTRVSGAVETSDHSSKIKNRFIRSHPTLQPAGKRSVYALQVYELLDFYLGQDQHNLKKLIDLDSSLYQLMDSWLLWTTLTY